MLTASDLNAYYGQAQVLKNIAITAENGEVVVIMGPNGHGKSTLLKTVCGLVDRAEGSVVYKGEEILGQPTDKIVNKGLIYIAENRELFPYMTVMENLKLGAFAKSARTNEKRNLAMVLDLFPRLADRRDQLASTMSGGEARMLAVARGLMSNAELLCVDEPSLGLQPSLRLEIYGIIKEINKQGKTVLLVEQNIPEITELADRIYVIEEGRISFEGNKDEALCDDHLREIFLGM